MVRRRDCVPCRVARHDRCTLADCGCSDPAHAPETLSEEGQSCRKCGQVSFLEADQPCWECRAKERKMGEHVTVSAVVPTGLRDRLRAQAEYEDRLVGVVIRRACEFYLAHHSPDDSAASPEG